MMAVQSEAELEALFKEAGDVWIFKHSSTCGVSQAANDEVESFLSAHPEQRLGRIIIQTHRPLSNLVAQQLSRVHQSPQIFLLRHGKVHWAASHWSVTVAEMEAALSSR